MMTSILPSFNKKYPPSNLNLLHDTCVIHISLSCTILLIKCHSYVIVMYNVLWNYFYSLALTWFLQNAVSLGSWILGFKHYRQQAMGKLYFLGFEFSWFKWTTKSMKIRTPWLIMISQYIRY
jgi:hypothetical protein